MGKAIKPISMNADNVLLRKADYEALLQALDDAEARAAFRKSNGQETFPTDVAHSLISGGHPVKVFRKYRKLSLSALEKQLDVSVYYLCKIESGRKPGSTKALSAVAKTLGVTLEDLI